MLLAEAMVANVLRACSMIAIQLGLHTQHGVEGESWVHESSPFAFNPLRYFRRIGVEVIMYTATMMTTLITYIVYLFLGTGSRLDARCKEACTPTKRARMGFVRSSG